MGFWFLDEKSQLALLIAGLMGTAGAAGCENKPVVVDPAPHDARVDGPTQVDPVPPDFRMERVRDARRGEPQVWDPLPRDFRLERRPRELGKLDGPLVVDMLPPDAAAASPAPKPKPGLPLDRNLRARIAVRSVGDGILELSARSSGEADPARLRYRWKVSGGQLDRSDAASVRWTLPGEPGLQIAELTVRDADRAIAVEVYSHKVK